MDGPRHYREAERLLAMAMEQSQQLTESKPVIEGQSLALGAQVLTGLAQVHATLALAAAQIDSLEPEESTTRRLWDVVTG